MKRAKTLAICLVCSLLCTHTSTAQVWPFSDGLYRIPYASNSEVRVNTDVNNHSPLGCIDIVGLAGFDVIVAAADGWIRAIRDSNTQICHPSLLPPFNYCCNEFNNFVIMEHPNGEWSSYIHMATGSVPVSVGQWVTAGTMIGIEGTIGCSTGPHLHLEITRPSDPTDTTPWDADGTLRGKGQRLDPVICGVIGSRLVRETYYTAVSCLGVCLGSINLSIGSMQEVRRANSTITSSASFAAGANAMYRAGTEIVLLPGFDVPIGSAFTAQLKGCNVF